MESGGLNKNNIYSIQDFDYNRFWHVKDQKRGRGNPRTKQKYKIKDIVTAFDIETSRITELDQSVMYIWQWCFYYGPVDYAVVVGRTWDDFLTFCQKICSLIEDQQRLIIYVHNLSYEFQFLRGIYNFSPDEVFCIKARKILTCSMNDKLFFRCSYLQTNMNLDTFTKKYGVKHGKLVGSLDYTKERYWYTELTEEEINYCINDVIGLCEAITAEMESDGDNLYTIPLTSTGYVRRDAKKAMHGINIADQLPDIGLYTLLREAFRGGNTHANRFYADMELKGEIHSADRSSSYPAVLCNNLYPVTKFFHVTNNLTWEHMEQIITIRHHAVIARVALSGLRLSDPYWGCPYIPVAKCRNLYKAVVDNGRVLAAEYLEITVTDVDLKIISDEYNFSGEVQDMYHARYGRLPKTLIDCVIEYYKRKTELKGVDGEELLYMKSKNKLNSIYGMMAQDPVKALILFNLEGSGEYQDDTSKDNKQLLAEYNERAFLAYQWGVWVTAWARLRLEEGIALAEKYGAFLYCDTDSVKYMGNVDFSTYNKDRVQECRESGSMATDPSGTVHYMGVFEQESDMTEFKTLGAKKYVYRDPSGTLHSTIAGVSKKAGAKELEEHGGIKAFKEGFMFNEAGGLEAVYNDDPEIKEFVTEDGVSIDITSNVCLKPSTYRIGLTDDYRRLISTCQKEEFDL